MEEFTAVQEKLLGESCPGTLALCLMSFEMYRRNRKAGEACLRLCNLSSNATLTISRLKTKFPEERYQESTDPYIQPYLVASYLKGAKEANKYTPDKPYVLTFTYTENSNIQRLEYSTEYRGTIYHYNVSWNGDGARDAAVMDLDDEDLCKVHDCANLVLSIPVVNDWEDNLL